MPTPLMRNSLRPTYERVTGDSGSDTEPHPGLLLRRGLAEHRGNEGDNASKMEHIARVCRSTAGNLYRRAYMRWRRTTEDAMRFRSVILELESRLFIGLAGGGMLETACAISHSHGIPFKRHSNRATSVPAAGAEASAHFETGTSA